jgi:hypothetical protein
MLWPPGASGFTSLPAITEMALGRPPAVLLVPSMGSRADIKYRAARGPGAQPVSKEDTGGIVLDAFADHHLPADIDVIKHPLNGVTGGGIRQFLFAPAKPMHRVEGGIFRDADEFEFQGAFGISHGMERE